MPLSAFSHVGSSAPGSSFQLPSWICDTTYLIPIVFVIIFILGAVARGRSRRSPYEEPQMSSGGFRALLRHINLDCPNDGMRLQRRNIQGTTIDFCEHCGGVYFDQGEIETLIEKGVNETQFNTTQVPSFSGYATPGTNICPRCHGTFEKITKTSDGRNASIYACKECKGIWVNKGIYQIIKEKRIDQDKEQQDKLRLVGDKESDKKQAVNAPSWWWFYPYIYYPRQYNRYIAPAPPVVHHSCACVSCACAGGCACACACAGGGAAGCAPKDTIYPQISFR
jgi:Zn-finger nucleic acid-binding protein